MKPPELQSETLPKRKIKKSKRRTEGVDDVVEPLLIKHEVLSSITRTDKEIRTETITLLL